MGREPQKRQPGIPVEFDGDQYVVVPQKQARLTRRLFGKEGVFGSFEELAEATGGEAGFDSLYDLIAGNAYEVLCVFIPGENGEPFMPRWRFDGYASEAAAEADDYNEGSDRSPTVPEIQEALRAAVQVNGLSWLSKIKDFVDPTVIRNQLTLTVARMGSAAREAAQLSQPSPSSQPHSGESEPTSSGTTDPTSSTPNGSDSPTPASSSTPEPTSAAAATS